MRLVRSPRLRACHLRRGLFRACALGLCLIAAPAVHASFWIDDEEVGPPPTLEQRRAAEPAEAPVAKAGGWLQWHDARYRLSSSGDLVCQSDNGVDCGDFSTAGRVAAWSLRVWPVTAFSALRQVEPVLTCGAPHARIWRGNDGYQQPDHWCNTVYATLFADWVDFTPHGVGYLLATTPNGTPMCHSTDGRTCSKAKDVDLTRREKRRVYPLICGEPHRAVNGITGFERADHWCTLGRDIGVLQSPFLRALRDAQRKSPDRQGLP